MTLAGLAWKLVRICGLGSLVSAIVSSGGPVEKAEACGVTCAYVNEGNGNYYYYCEVYPQTYYICWTPPGGCQVAGICC